MAHQPRQTRRLEAVPTHPLPVSRLRDAPLNPRAPRRQKSQLPELQPHTFRPKPGRRKTRPHARFQRPRRRPERTHHVRRRKRSARLRWPPLPRHARRLRTRRRRRFVERRDQQKSPTARPPAPTRAARSRWPLVGDRRLGGAHRRRRLAIRRTDRSNACSQFVRPIIGRSHS